ncbi:MAG: GNAT family N-acetyltransferase [Betaproteobacteria bacterium]|nr:GNAT family N-acetyltransferase [Betaproteobacteria bacterium]
MSANSSTAPPIRTAIVRSRDGFLKLQDHWDPFIETCGNGVVFARWDWVRIWLDIFGTSESPLAIICIWRGQTLIGLAPFWIQPRRHCGWTVRTLRFLGTGELEADEVLPEMLDVMCRKEDTEPVARAVVTAIERELQWDAAIFDHVVSGSVIETAIVPSLATPETAIRSARGARYRLQWPAGQVPKLPSAVAYKRRKLERAGQLEYQFVGSMTGWETSIETLTALHRKRWEARGVQGVFASAKFDRFHRTLSQHWVAQGGVCLHMLRLDGLPIAALYNLRWHGVEYFYQGGIDTSLKGQSPGIVLHAFAIEHAARSGSTAYDFLGGEAQSYKSIFGVRAEPLAAWFIPRTWRGRLARMLHRV